MNSSAQSEIQHNDGFQRHVTHHRYALHEGLRRLYRNPLANLMTLLVIGIALAAPMGLYLVLQNMQVLSQGWDRGTSISLFLKQNINPIQAEQLAQQLRLQQTIAQVNYISPETGLHQFEREAGFNQVLHALPSNPLPAVLQIQPASSLETPAEIRGLLTMLKQLPEVQVAQLDMEWIKRLYSLVTVGQRAVVVLASFIGIAVLLIIANTIRLTVQSDRYELEMIALMGATPGFIRRPFIYAGALYGIVGGGVAVGLLMIAIAWLYQPMQQLLGLYNSQFHLIGLGPMLVAILLLGGMALGAIGSWLVLAQHLRRLKPV